MSCPFRPPFHGPGTDDGIVPEAAGFCNPPMLLSAFCIDPALFPALFQHSCSRPTVECGISPGDQERRLDMRRVHLAVVALGIVLMAGVAAQQRAEKNNMELVGFSDLQGRSAYQP